jgi:hypothetical protein
MTEDLNRMKRFNRYWNPSAAPGVATILILSRRVCQGLPEPVRMSWKIGKA